MGQVRTTTSNPQWCGDTASEQFHPQTCTESVKGTQAIAWSASQLDAMLIAILLLAVFLGLIAVTHSGGPFSFRRTVQDQAVYGTTRHNMAFSTGFFGLTSEGRIGILSGFSTTDLFFRSTCSPLPDRSALMLDLGRPAAAETVPVEVHFSRSNPTLSTPNIIREPNVSCTHTRPVLSSAPSTPTPRLS